MLELDVISKDEQILSGKTYVLSIAIDEYQSKDFRNLSNSVKDSELILNALSKYKIETPIRLYDNAATEKRIFKEIENLNNTMDNQDNLIIIWNGHGEKDKYHSGYLILNNSIKSDKTSWLSYNTLVNWLKYVDKKHIILLINSCYSGSIFTETRSSYIQNNISEDMRKTSRWGLVSGSFAVSDGQKGKGSPFANAITNFLENPNNKEFLSIRNLTQSVKIYIHQKGYSQDPHDGIFDIRSHKNGIFHFQLKEDEETLYQKVIDSNSIKLLNDFLYKFPNGNKAKDIREKIVILEKHQKKLIKFLQFTTSELEQLTDSLNPNHEIYKKLNDDKIIYKNLLDKLTIQYKIQEDWSKIENSDDFDKWLDFIYEYEAKNNSNLIDNYLNKARIKHDILSKKIEDVKEWNNIKKRTKHQRDILKFRDAYIAYIYKFPNGNYSDKAHNILNEIEFFIKAKKNYDKNGNITSLEDYYIRNQTSGFDFTLKQAKKILDKSKLQDKTNEELQIFNELKKSNSVRKLKDFIENSEIEEIKLQAIDFLNELEEMIKDAFNDAKISKDIHKLYAFTNTYKDCEENVEAQQILNEQIETNYDETIKKVYEEKSIKPIENYLNEFQQYSESELFKTKSLENDLEKFKIDINDFEIAQNDGTKDAYLIYKTNHPNGIFIDEAQYQIDNFDKTIKEKELSKKCIRYQQIEDLRAFVAEFKNSKDFAKIELLWMQKEAFLEARNLYLETKLLVEKDERKKAMSNIHSYEIKFGDSQQHHLEMTKFKDFIKLINNEDTAFDSICNTTDFEDKKDKCYRFLANPNYTRRKKEVEEVLDKLKYGQALMITQSAPINIQAKNNKGLFFYKFKKTDIIYISIIITLLFIIILLYR